MQRIVLASFFSLVAILSCMVPGIAGEPRRDDRDKITARIEVEAKGDFFIVKFFVKNDGEDDLDVIIGRGRQGKKVATLHFAHGSDTIEITPPVFKRPGSRAMRPDLLRLTAHKEVLYDSYRLGFPDALSPGGGMGPSGTPTLSGEIEFEVSDQRRRLTLRSKTVPFPVEALPKPAR